MPLFGNKEKPFPVEPIDELLKKIRERARQKTQPASQKKEKKDTSIFGGKPYLPKQEVIWKFKKAPPAVPGSGGAMYSGKERAELAKKITGKWGSFLEKEKEVPKIFKELEKEKYRAKTGAEKLKVDRQIRYLRRQLEGK